MLLFNIVVVYHISCRLLTCCFCCCLLGDNPWQSPVDGACYDDSCICLNQLGHAEIIVGIIITTTGILLCCALLIVNCQLRNNK